MITSIHNDKVKSWVKLQDKKYRDDSNLFLVEGNHLVLEAIKCHLVKEIISLEPFDTSLDCYLVSLNVMKKITNLTSPPSICAVCYKKECVDVSGNVLLLDGISDPGNLGTIIRSAVAFRMPNIVLSNDCVDLYNPKVIRACEGMNFYQNIIRTDLEDFIVKHPDYVFYGTDVIDGKNIRDVSLGSNIGLIIGNEGNGMRDSLKKYCDCFFYIPMDGNCESLNAGVSASILMYEISFKR